MIPYVIVDNRASPAQMKDYFDAPEGVSKNDLLVQLVGQGAIPSTEGYSLHEMDLNFAHYYPRIGRPQHSSVIAIGKPAVGPFFDKSENMTGPTPFDDILMASALNYAASLIADIKIIFEYVEAHRENLEVFGPRIRDVLISASTEFENQCKGVMRANGYSAPNDRWSTRDFVKLLAPLALDAYEASLPYYPAIPKIIPFAGWSATNPTQTLQWYDAYNAVKHDREACVSKATVHAAVSAVTACGIMLAAQYRLIKGWDDQIGSFFFFEKVPKWELWNYYVPPKVGEAWQATGLSF